MADKDKQPSDVFELFRENLEKKKEDKNKIRKRPPPPPPGPVHEEIIRKQEHRRILNNQPIMADKDKQPSDAFEPFRKNLKKKEDKKKIRNRLPPLPPPYTKKKPVSEFSL